MSFFLVDEQKSVSENSLPQTSIGMRLFQEHSQDVENSEKIETLF